MSRKKAVAKRTRGDNDAINPLEEQSMHSFALVDADDGERLPPRPAARRLSAPASRQRKPVPKSILKPQPPPPPARTRANVSQPAPVLREEIAEDPLVPQKKVKIVEKATVGATSDAPSPTPFGQGIAAESSDDDDDGSVASMSFQTRVPGQMSDEHSFKPVETGAKKSAAAPPPLHHGKPSPLQSTPKPVPTKATVREAQHIKRSAARNALESLRRGDIPNYDERVDDAQRDIVIDRDQFRSLINDTPRDYQNMNKPPWAPSVPEDQVKKLQNFILLSTLQSLGLRAEAWYSFLVLVGGIVRLQPSALILIPPQTSSVSAVRTAGVSRRGPVGGPSDSGATVPGVFSDPLFAGATAVTPIRSDTEGNTYRFGSSGTVDQQGHRVDLRETRDDFGAARRDDGRTHEPIIDAVLAGNGFIDQFGSNLGTTVLPDNNADRMRSDLFDPLLFDTPQRGSGGDGAFGVTPSRTTIDTSVRYRFRDLRERQDAQVPDTWYASGMTRGAIEANQAAREAGARGLGWIAAPAATGVAYVNPFVLSARELGYAKLTSRAFHLAHVRPYYFMRDDPNDHVQMRVRALFAVVVASEFNMDKQNSNSSDKLAADAANIAAMYEDAAQVFENRISFNSHTGRFSDVGPARAVNRQPVWCRAAALALLEDPYKDRSLTGESRGADAQFTSSWARGDIYRNRSTFAIATDPLRDDYGFKTLAHERGTLLTSMQ